MQVTAGKRNQHIGRQAIVIVALGQGLLAAATVGALALMSEDTAPLAGQAATVERAPFNRSAAFVVPTDRMREYHGTGSVAATAVFVMPTDRMREYHGAGSAGVATEFVVPTDRMREYFGVER